MRKGNEELAKARKLLEQANTSPNIKKAQTLYRRTLRCSSNAFEEFEVIKGTLIEGSQEWFETKNKLKESLEIFNEAYYGKKNTKI